MCPHLKFAWARMSAAHNNRMRQKEMSKRLGISEERISEFREAFDLFDADGSGNINARELENCMSAFGVQVTEEEAIRMIAATDKDNSGEIDFEEFVAMMTAKMSTKSSDADLQKVFKVFDSTGKGKITFSDLQRVCDMVGETISDADLMEMIKVADRNHDQAVDFKEFVDLLHRKRAAPLDFDD